MSQEPVTIEPGAEGDLPAIVEILNHMIMNSNATLMTEPLTVAGRLAWFRDFGPAGPGRIFVARRGGRVIGYAASRPYRPGEAFRETVEFSVVLAPDSRGQGAGTALYQALIDSLADEQVRVALAGIVLPNEASVALHRKAGFTEVGVFHDYAIKNGQYLSSVWMERPLP